MATREQRTSHVTSDDADVDRPLSPAMVGANRSSPCRHQNSGLSATARVRDRIAARSTVPAIIMTVRICWLQSAISHPERLVEGMVMPGNSRSGDVEMATGRLHAHGEMGERVRKFVTVSSSEASRARFLNNTPYYRIPIIVRFALLSKVADNSGISFGKSCQEELRQHQGRSDTHHSGTLHASCSYFLCLLGLALPVRAQRTCHG